MRACRVLFVRELDPKNAFLPLTVRIALMHAGRVPFVRELGPKKFLFASDRARSADARRSRTWQGIRPISGPKKSLFATDSAHSADARRSRALRSRT